MSKEQDDFNVDEIVIEEVDIQDIEERNLNMKKGDDPIVRESQKEKSKKKQNKGDSTRAADAEIPAVAADHTPERVPVHAQTDLEEDDSDEDDDDEDGKEQKPRRTIGDVVRYIIMFLALGVLVYAVFSLVSIYMEYKAGEQIYEDMTQYANETQEPPEQQPVQEYIEDTEPLNPNFTPAVIDWAGLQAQNPDICAWIQFESDSLKDSINYPIAHGTDNEYYLKHTVNFEENSAGSIFIEALNRTDFSDMNTFVYGHNMKNGSMFGLLRYYKEASYYAGNEFFWVYTPQGNYRYKIFSCYEPHAESETYTWWSDPCDEYTEYLKKVKSYSKYDTGVNVKPTDHIVTLSTCTSRGSDYRFVVHGKLVYSELKQTAVPQQNPADASQNPADAGQQSAAGGQ